MKGQLSRPSFASVIALIALFCAVGGVSYAATQLPVHSVGPAQLQRQAVTSGKLADQAVRRRALGKGIAKGLTQPVSYSAQGTPSGTDSEVLFDVAGLKFEASCTSSGGQTEMSNTITSSHDGVIQDNFNVDTGTDPHVPSPLQSGTIQIDLPAGQAVAQSQPPVSGTDYFRVMATLVYSSGSRVITGNIATFVDGTTGKCSAYGTFSVG